MKNNLQFIEEKIQAFDIFYRAKALGIYFGQDRVTVAQVSKQILKIKVLAGGSFPNPLTHIPGAPIEDVEKLIKGIVNILKLSDGDWDEVIIGLPRHNVILKQISIPAPNKKLIPDMLNYEIERHIPFMSTEAYCDYYILSRNEGNVFNIHLTAVKREIVEYYLNILQQTGLKPSIIDISSNAVVNMLMFNFPNMLIQKGNVILVHQDGCHVEIMLIKKGEFILSRSVKNKITDNTAPCDNDKFGEFLGEEINKTIANHSFGFLEGEDKAQIIVLGIDGAESDINEKLEFHTGLKTEFIDTCFKEKKLKIKALASKKTGAINPLRDIASIGLALRGLTGTPMCINLIPKEIRLRRKKYGRFITMGLTAVVIMLVLFIGLSNYLRNRSQLDLITKKLDEVKKKAVTVEKAYLKKEELKNMFDSFKKLKSTSISKLNIMLKLTSLLPENVWIKEIQVLDDNLEILGYAKSASPLINILEKSPVFKDVKFSGRITTNKGKEKFKLKAAIANESIDLEQTLKQE